MAATLPNPSFETDSDWTLVDAIYTDFDAYDGSRSVALFSGYVDIPRPRYYSGTASVTVSGLCAHSFYRVRLHAKQDAAPVVPVGLNVTVTWPGGETQVVLDAYPFEELSWSERSGVFVALGPDCVLKIKAERSDYRPPKVWYVDALELETLMPSTERMYLSKRAVLGVLQHLMTGYSLGFNAAASQLWAEQSLAYSQPAVDRWIPFKHDRFIANEAQVEVWEESCEFVDWPRFWHTWGHPPGQGRLIVTETTLAIRATVVNKVNRSRGEMMNVIRDFSTGITRSLVQQAWTNGTPPDQTRLLNVSIFDDVVLGDDAAKRAAAACVVRAILRWVESDNLNGQGTESEPWISSEVWKAGSV